MNRRVHKTLAMALAIIMATGALAFSMPAAGASDAAEPSAARVTLAAWNCTAAGAGKTGSFPATGGAAGYQNNNITLQTAAGAAEFTKAVAAVAGMPASGEASGSSWAAWPQTVDPDMYWRIELDTNGYEEVELSFHGYGTSTSPASWEAKYSVDGVTYQSFGPDAAYTVDTTNTPANATQVTLPLSGLEGLEDADGAAYVGLFATAAATNGSGNNRLCNVKATGKPIGGGGDTGEPETPEVPGPIAMTIAEAISKPNGTAVTVEGVLTYNTRNSAGTSDNGVYMQDGSGAGINVRPGSGTVSSTDVKGLIGKAVRVTGEINNFNGLIQLQNRAASNPQLFSIEVINDNAAMPATATATVQDIATMKYPFMLVAVENVLLKSKDNSFTSGHSSYTIEQGGAAITLNGPAQLPPGIAVGDWITVTKGVSTAGGNTPQLYVNSDSANDIAPGIAPPPPDTSGTDGEGTLAEWCSPTVTDVIGATGGVHAGSTLSIVGTASTALNWANGAINRSGGFDGRPGAAYWLAELSSEGFSNIKASWGMRSSGTGPRDFKLQYSVDGATWHDANAAAFTVGNGLNIADPASQYNKTLPNGADGNSTLWIRWLLSGEASANGNTIASAGSNSINNIIITGDYTLAEGQLRAPSAEPAGGELALGQAVVFAPGPGEDAGVPGYCFMVSEDGGLTWGTADGNSYMPASLPATLQVKASAPGMADSRTLTYEYTQTHLPLVVPSRNPGAVTPGATLALSCPVSGAAINYTVNGGEAMVYGGPLTLDNSLFIGEPATLTISAWAEKEGCITGEVAEYSYTVAVSGGEKVYFGMVHSHTSNSDGTGTLAEAYRYARYTAGLDFFAVTDHSNSFDETGASSDNPATIDLGTYNTGSAKWQAGTAAAADAYAEGEFVSFYGYEMTWSGGPGHMNTFNTGGFVSRNNSALNSKSGDAGLRAYYELLRRNPESVSMFNHPGTTFGNFSNFGYFDPVTDQRVTLVEVGNGEGAIGSGGYFPSYGQYTLALDKGWHVAPANNQDNHMGKWGNSNTARTAIWTNDLTLGGVYQALRDMRVYSTEVADLEIVYKVNGQPLGSILDVVPGTASFTASIVNPTAGNIVKSVCLVTNGGAEIARETPNTQNYDYNRTVANPAAGYYYLKAVISTPAGDRIAVTAPVWLGQGKAAGFTEVTKSAAMPVTGEELTITSTLFNNESKPATLASIEYKDHNGAVLGSFDNLNTPIPQSGEASHSFSFTPAAAGPVTVTATALVRFSDGSGENFTHDIPFEVWDADKLVYIGVDASHYNEYVDGNYKDSIGNFSAVAAEHGVRVNILWTDDELAAAAGNPKYRALILTAPSRRVDPVATNPATGQAYGAHRSYSPKILEAIAAFAENGGTVVTTGWSNLYESYAYTADMQLDEHMSSQQNKLLAAIGSTLRLSDDAAKDPNQWSSATDQYRLYLTDAFGSYNWSSPLLAGADTHQIFSQYGGSTIYTVEASDKGAWDADPSAEVPASVSPAVMMSVDGESENRESRPSGTNYRTDYTKYGDRRILLASETVTHPNGTESLVVAAGGAFMSDFEVKAEMDNASSLQYSNYNIALSVIMSVAPQATVTGIADVKGLPQGTRVTIEGTATTNVYSGDSAANTGFFDCIYVQDSTGGINLFPVSSGVAEGQGVRVSGTVSAYQGETQIAVTSIEVIDSAINSVSPSEMTTADAMSPANTGLLVKVTGTVSNIYKTSGVVSQFTVTDASGAGALVYINAYITGGADLSFVKDGATVSAIGLASIGENQGSSDPQARIRVRDRNEIAPVDDAGTDKPSGGGPGTGGGSGGAGGEDGGQEIPDPSTPTTDGNPFTDVNENDWFYDDVLFVYDNGLMNGTSDDTFKPRDTLSRAMAVTVLWRLAGSPGSDDTSDARDAGFSDVEDGKWYSEAVAWAAANKIVDGYGDGSFGLEDSITRQDLATIIMRYLNAYGVSIAVTDEYVPFADEGSIAAYAMGAVRTLNKLGVIRGTDMANGMMMIDPKGTASRAEAAAIMHRTVEALELVQAV